MIEKKLRFEKDLERLIDFGEKLHFSIQYDCFGKEFKEEIAKLMGQKNVAKFLAELPNFKTEYQVWYSEAQTLIKQILPDRLAHFNSHYEFPRVRKEIDFQNYVIRDYLQGLCVTKNWGKDIVADGKAAIPEFVQQVSIVKAARDALDSTLMDLKTILQADIFDSEIDSAKALLKSGFLRAAGAICGVVIEKHLKQVCEARGITVRKKIPEYLT